MTDFPDRLATALKDRYRIERRLGEGGMATVYLAEDVKHKRQVALKVLKPELAAVLGADRFVQEITTTAGLQHPHILPLFDSGEADGFLYYVMPYIEGETLRQTLDRETQLGVDEAVAVATEIADALDCAHQQGVIHRDIKPENILMQNGRPMVADFGIALAVSAAAGGRMTETGLSLGTPHYMSPEQATAEKDLNARSDIYSLGAVLFEMLTGEPPHMGTTAQQIIMKIVTDEPRSVTDLRRSVPPHISATVRKALERLPADRFHDAAEFKRALSTPTFGLTGETAVEGTSGGTAGRRVPLWVWPVTAALAVFGAVGWLRSTPEPVPGVLARFAVQLPPTQQLGNQPGRRVVISPDGRHIVYVGEGPEGRQLYVRPLRNQQSRLIAGTRNASQPFFSPDGRSVGFNALGGVFQVSIEGGAPQRIASFGSAGGSWGPDGTIILSSQDTDGLMSVAVDGSREPIELTVPDSSAGETGHIEPLLIPGRNAVIFQSNLRDFDGSHISVLDLDDGSITRLVDGRSPRLTPSGHLIFISSGGVMRAALFDTKRLELVGDPFKVLEGIGLEDQAAEYSVSDNGTLVYVAMASAEERSLVIVDRQGGEREVARIQRQFFGPRFSPDGNRIAVHISGGNFGFDIWVADLTSNDLRKFTLNQRSYFPSWTPDGRYLSFSRRDENGVSIYRKRADGASEEELVFAGEGGMWEASWTPDGRSAVVRQNAPQGGSRDLWLWTMDPEPAGRPLLDTDANERSPAVSADGRYYAYASDESGQSEIYVKTLNGAGRWQVSSSGGTEPAWSPRGGELFYRQEDQIMAVAVQTQPVFESGQPAPAFSGPYATYSTHTNYDVHPDGNRFAMIKVGDSESQLVIVMNWFEVLNDPAALD
jgi:serine/threonine-protein kinase